MAMALQPLVCRSLCMLPATSAIYRRACNKSNTGMKSIRYRIPALLVSLLAGFSPSGICRAEDARPDAFSAQQIAFFETKIRPVLIERCAECHSGDNPESRFSVESRAALLAGGEFGPALKPGNPAGSLLISAINHDEFLKMPPKEKLPTQQVVDLTRWVKMGAPWPDSNNVANLTATGTNPDAPLFTRQQKNYWAFQPPVLPTLPAIKNTTWSRSPIDHMILARLENADLTPARPTTKRTLLRRATFDLLGLPPTPNEVDTFLDDDSPAAFERAVDRLLASPRYGERWGRHWLDVARYADSNGLDENLSYANAFRYRDYVINAFNKDKPYARFIQEQIAGDLLAGSWKDDSPLERFIATGFLAIGPKMLAEDDPTKMQMDIIDEQVSTIGQAFMGLTLGCCRCHDHKFDPLPTQDYYSLAGIFKSTKTMENHKVVAVWYERPLVTPQRAEQIELLKTKVKEAEKQIATLKEQATKSVTSSLRAHVQSYLTASVNLERLQTAFQGPQSALGVRQDQPYVVENGYLALEAEIFHRGNVVITLDGYGQGIGIIGSRGAAHAEYDIDVKKAGRYAVEIRYAAAESRPIGLLLDGQQVGTSILSAVTGSWYPDTQRWVSAVQLQLTPGKHTLRFDSPKVYPHIDKLAIVWAGKGKWPFQTKEPTSITRSASAENVEPALVATWSDYFKALDEGKHQSHVAFRPWLALRKLDPAKFVEQAAPILTEIQSNTGLGERLPEPLKKAFHAQPPQSLVDVAALYQRLTNRLREAYASDNQEAQRAFASLQTEFASAVSPLSAPKDLPESAYPATLREQRSTLLAQIKSWKTEIPEANVAMGVTEGQVADIRVHLRGSHITLGDTAPRQMLRIIAGEHQKPIDNEHSGRLEFANWLASEKHPLVSRVMVNRIWRWRFGRGIVASVDNFGSLGSRPTHPRLLDWLALEFSRQQGSLKALHRIMLSSSTYQMSSQYNANNDRQDPENKLLWRMRRRRLSGEELRDSVLQIGPGMDHVMGGTLLKVKNRAYVTGSGTNITNEYDNLRRSVYLPVIRSAVFDVLQTMDFPDPAVSNGDRITTTVAPQALLMMNSSLVQKGTSDLAKQVANLPTDQRVESVYRLVLGRQPSGDDADLARQFIVDAESLARKQGSDPAEATLKAWRSFSRVLLSSNDFMYVE